MLRDHLKRVLPSVGFFFLLSIYIHGQSEQEQAVQAVINSAMLSEIEDYQGVYVFKKQHWNQLNYGIVQTNWQLGKQKKRNSVEEIGLRTLSRNNVILHIEAYKWEYNVDWDGIDLQYVWNYSTLDSRSTSELDSLINLDHLSKLPAEFTFGYGCGAAGSIPEEGERMLKLIEDGNVEELDSWLYSINPTLQAYAYLGFKLLEKNGKILDLKTVKQMKQVAGSTVLVFYCSGCTVWDHRPLYEVLDKRDVDDFLARH